MTCSHSTPQWHLADCNEDGWKCTDCGHKFGYRPDFDREHTSSKVDAILFWLVEHDFIYLSNASEADYVRARVTNQCREQNTFDQQSIVHMIAAHGLDHHAAFWREQAQQFFCKHIARSLKGDSSVCEACGHEVKQKPDTDLSLFSKEPF